MSGLRGLLTPAEAAARLGLSRARVYAIIRDGRLATVRVGGRILVRESSVAKFKPRPRGRPRKKPVKEARKRGAKK